MGDAMPYGGDIGAVSTRYAEVRMFSRVTYAHYPPKVHDAGLRIVLADLLPALRRATGYRGCYLLADSKPGTGLAVVLWETEEDADAASADREVSAAYVQIAALGLTFVSRQLYEVVIADVGARGRSG